MYFDEDVLLIAGPTASGKTTLSIDAAAANDAVVINSDSMQVYIDLQVISARPNDDEMRGLPHKLFGHVDGAFAYSVAQWLDDVAEIIKQIDDRQRKLIFVGGTGLYFSSLLSGLSPVPSIEPDVREKWRRAASDTPSSELHQQLFELDPRMAASLEPNDTQRIVRALEVIESTGRSLAEWQDLKGPSLFGEEVRIRKLLVMPERSVLRDRINCRFDLMVQNGALDEVKVLMKRKLDPALPVMKAIGVPQLGAYLRGETSLEVAVDKAKVATRQYAKRQATWFRNTFDDNWEQFTG